MVTRGERIGIDRRVFLASQPASGAVRVNGRPNTSVTVFFSVLFGFSCFEGVLCYTQTMSGANLVAGVPGESFLFFSCVFCKEWLLSMNKTRGFHHSKI
jgi:hypothetical protein